MKPTIGRIVIYHFSESEAGAFNNTADNAPAIITRVWSDLIVNLTIFSDGAGSIMRRTSVKQGIGGGQWSWPEKV